MDFVFLPMKAIFLILAIVGAIVGALYFKSIPKPAGAVIGGTLMAIAISCVMFLMPVKLTTNTIQYNQKQVSAAYERHKHIPEKIVVETKSFLELQAEEAQRSLIEDQKLKESLQ